VRSACGRVPPWRGERNEKCLWAGPTQRKKEKEKIRAAKAALIRGD